MCMCAMGVQNLCPVEYVTSGTQIIESGHPYLVRRIIKKTAWQGEGKSMGIAIVSVIFYLEPLCSHKEAVIRSVYYPYEANRAVRLVWGDEWLEQHCQESG